MRLILKVFIYLFVFFYLLWFSQSFASYIYYYWESCSHCAKVASYMDKNDIVNKYNVVKKEVYNNQDNREELLSLWQKLWLSLWNIWVPFLYDEENNNYLKWDSDIIDYFKTKELNLSSWSWSNSCDINDESCNEKITVSSEQKLPSFFKFLLILLPAALSDSINPCAFAVLFLLMSSILTRFNSYKKAIFSWLLFSLAIFISYFLMWVWIYKVFSFTNQIFYLKIWVWVLWILVWLANIKDYFWYWKWFVMEVPFAWRKNMKNIISKAVSPIWVFFIWFLVSLFLLPCTSWPYFTILWYLASESSYITTMWYVYMFIYNLIFILPMIIITFIIWLWVKDIAELKELKETHKENIHLIVWILMLLLWIYLIYDLF